MPPIPPDQVSPYYDIGGSAPSRTDKTEDQRRNDAHRPRGPPDPAELLDDDAAATALRVTKATLASWRAHGRGPVYFKIGRRCFYQPSDLRAWLEHQRMTPRPSSERRPVP